MSARHRVAQPSDRAAGKRSQPVAGRAGGPRRPASRRVVAMVGAAGLLVAIGAAIALAGGARFAPPTVPIDTVVARVHGEVVTWAPIAERLEAAVAMGRAPAADLTSWRDLVHEAIEAAVRDVLTRQTMEAQGVQVTEAAIDAEIATVREHSGGEAGFQEAMASMHVTMAQLRETKRQGLFLQAMIDRFVPASDADVDAYLARPGAAGLSRAEAAARVRAERAAEVIPALLDGLRDDPDIWVIDVAAFD